MKRSTHAHRLSWTAVLAASLSLSFGIAHAKPEVRTYTVQPGDSIWSIAAEFYGSGRKYRIIYRYNDLRGAGPHVLRPGQVLKLPQGDVSPEAQLAWVHDEVRAKPPRGLDALRANPRMNLWKQYEVSTGARATALVLFEDASHLSLGADTIAVIHGGAYMSPRTRERTSIQVQLRQGTVRGGLAPNASEAAPPLEVDTPAGLVSMTSGDTQIRSDARHSVVSVYDGVAQVSAAGATVSVPADHGLIAEKGKKPGDPQPLPSAPGWTFTDAAAAAIAPSGGKASFEVAWNSVAGAASYFIELAGDERFDNVVVRAEAAATATRFSFGEIAAGSYHARVSARDAKGLQGRASKALRIDVLAMSSSRRMVQDEAGRWEVVGFTRLDLGAAGAGLEWALDDEVFASGVEPKRVIGRGPHALKVRRVGQSMATALQVQVLGVDGVLDLGPPGRLEAGGAGRLLTLTVTDEKGRPASLPEVVIESDHGGPVPLLAAGPGRFTAMLPAPEPPGPREILVRAKWPGGVLGRGYIEVERKLLEPYVYRWPVSLAAIGWQGRQAATPLPSIVPVERVGTETLITSGSGDTVASLTLHGETALLDNRLALDGALTFFRLGLGPDVGAANELGDALLGTRYLVLRDKYLTLAASLRARLPLGPEDRIGVGLEPSVLARLRLFELLWVDTRQGIFATLGSAGDLSYVGDYALVVMPLGIDGLVGLSAQLDTAVSFDDSVPLALGAGLGAHFHLGRVRLGLEVGFGFGDGGKQRYGEVNAGVVLDFGLGTP